jgi:integrase
MAEATLEKEKLTYALTKRRNRVLGLAQFDQLQNTLTQSAEPEVALVNTLLTLGFYGGLRSGEMLALTLDDIEVCGPEIYVWIRRGKTPAARRKIPLHLIAPPRVCQQFLEYLDTRRAVARQYKAKPKKVAFIGPTGCVEGFAREEIVPAVIGLLRYYVGQDYEMHSLRHGFGTWLMLRAYALKYPELKGQLLEQQHVVFSGEGEKRFTQLFTWSEDQPLRQDRIDLFIHIRKIMGHSHISVLLQNYMHGFGVIHQFLMRRM